MNKPFNYIRNFRKDEKLKKWGNDITGYVIACGVNNKTVTVKAYWKRYIPRYQSWAYAGKKYSVHDEDSSCGLGDHVVIRNCFPVSKNKHFFVKKILRFGIRNNLWEQINEDQKVSLV